MKELYRGLSIEGKEKVKGLTKKMIVAIMNQRFKQEAMIFYEFKTIHYYKNDGGGKLLVKEG